MWTTIRPVLLTGIVVLVTANPAASQRRHEIWLRVGGQVVVEPAAGTVAREFATEPRSRLKEGVLIGLGVGIGTTAVFLAAFCGGDTVCGTDEVLRAGAIFTIPAVVIGGAIGAAIHVERWRPVAGRSRDASWSPVSRWTVGVSLRP